MLNEDYEEAVTYNYYRYYRDWSQLKDHDQWISQSKIPLTILSQRDPANPDKAYTAEEIHERTRFPLTMIGLQMYLESVKAGIMPSIRHKRSEGK
ncbi:MAG: hypothetical protein ABEI86_01710, partial [Halobacteriaceae archaeon]